MIISNMNMYLQRKNKIDHYLLLWLIVVLILVFFMVIIGGITRLTDSGLSMIEWRPLYGILPPLGHEEWNRVFKLYKNSPEYIYYNKGMNLSEFKFIFFWEFFHRLFGRIIGVVFIVPFIYFAIKKYLSKNILLKLIIIFFFGFLQGIIGWWMVESGLSKDPYISQYRLTLHLGNAFFIMFLLVWLIMDLREGFTRIKFNLGLLTLLILVFTILAGAFVAGMDAGLMYNTYPLMNGNFFPDQYLELGIFDPFENPGSAQFHHRHLGLFSLLVIFYFYYKNFNNKMVKYRLNFLIFLIIVQFGLGIFILNKFVPVPLASLHQIGAMIIFILLTTIIHTQNRDS